MNLEPAVVVDAILVLVAIEGAVLLLLRRRLGLAATVVVWNLLAGAFLLLAVRAVLTAGGTHWLFAWLLAALVAHLADLRARAQRPLGGGSS